VCHMSTASYYNMVRGAGFATWAKLIVLVAELVTITIMVVATCNPCGYDYGYYRGRPWISCMPTCKYVYAPWSIINTKSPAIHVRDEHPGEITFIHACLFCLFGTCSTFVNLLA